MDVPFALDDGAPVDLRCSMLVFRGQKILLCHRDDRARSWVLPGGTPRQGESTAAAARREVEEETGLQVEAERVAFVLEASSWDRGHHMIEIVFLGAEREMGSTPQLREPGLDPSFVDLDGLGDLNLRPPIAGYVRGFFSRRHATAAYLGNVWRPEAGATEPAPR